MKNRYFALLFLLPVELLAADSAAPEIISRASVSNAIMSLGFILLLIVGLGWLVKKFNAVNIGGKGKVQILAGVSVGTREKVVLLEAEGAKLLVGVAPGSIRTLHVYQQTVEQAQTSFDDMLKDQQS